MSGIIEELYINLEVLLFMISRKQFAFKLVAKLSVIFALFLFITAAPFTFAQGSAGVSISPALIEETVDPGQVKSYSVDITNLNNGEQTFYLLVRNIRGVTDNNAPIFTKDNNERTGYELSDWVTLETTEVTLAAGEERAVNFTVDVPGNASPGSHFGGVFITVEPPEMDTVGAAVGYQVANIISMRVSGEVTEQASIRQFSTDKFLYGSQNIDFSVRIQNEGNVLVRPTGPVEIFNMLGEKVDTIIFNENQSAVFPFDEHEFRFNWEGEGIGFGRYEAILSPVYGENGAKKTMSSTVTFWVLPMNIIGPAAAVLGFLLLVTYISVRVYIKRTLAQLSYGGTRVIQRRRRKSGTPTMLLLTVVMLTVTAVFMIVLLALFA